MKLEKTEGVVLRYYDYGDTSRIVVLLTRDFGKLKVMAKGVKGRRSPFAGRLELFYVVEILFYHNPANDLHTLKEVSGVRVFPSFHERLIAFAAASYLVELVQTAVHGEESGGVLYETLVQTLDAIAKDGDWELALRWFEVQVLRDLGVMPRLKVCAQCGGALEERFYLTPWHGGFVCDSCLPENAPALPISPAVTQTLQFLSRVELAKTGVVKLTLPQRVELKKVLRNFLDFVLERRLKSLEFLERLTASSME